jgi:hypothetical protein
LTVPSTKAGTYIKVYVYVKLASQIDRAYDV